MKPVKRRDSKSAKTFEHFFNLSHDMLCVAGLDGYFRLLNPAFERTLGYTDEELLSRPFYEFVHPEDRDKNISELQALKAGIPLIYCEHRYLCKDGSYKWLAWRSYTDVDKGLIYAVARDITSRVHLENEKKLFQAKMIHANKMASLGTLVSGIAHEINNPNAFISSNAHLVLRIWEDMITVFKKHEEEFRNSIFGGFPYLEVLKLVPRLLEGIEEGSQRIQNILDELRNFVRPEKASLEGRIDVNKVVRASQSILSTQIKKYTERFQLICGSEIPLVKGSSQQIEQVVINLIMNALQALEDKNRGVRVSTYHEKKIMMLS
jgi:hypothetical protein